MQLMPQWCIGCIIELCVVDRSVTMCSGGHWQGREHVHGVILVLQQDSSYIYLTQFTIHGNKGPKYSESTLVQPSYFTTKFCIGGFERLLKHNHAS